MEIICTKIIDTGVCQICWRYLKKKCNSRTVFSESLRRLISAAPRCPEE